MTLRALAFLILLSPVFAHEAYADSLFVLSTNSLNSKAGGSVEFSGTITNTGSDDLYLNGDVSILSFSFLNVDDSLFFQNAPLFLPSGDSYSGPLFNVAIDPASVSGSYSGLYTVQGGGDSDTFQNLGTASFTVNVESAVPEPLSFVLCTTGVLFLYVLNTVRSKPFALYKALPYQPLALYPSLDCRAPRMHHKSHHDA